MQQLICHCRFRYTTTFKEAFLQNSIATLQNLDNQGWVAGWDANVFVSNHDTERVRHQFLFFFTPKSLLCRTLSPSTRTLLQTLTYWPPFSPCMFPTSRRLFRDSFLTIDYLFVLSNLA